MDGVVGGRIIGTGEGFQADEGGAADVLRIVELADEDGQEGGVAELADGLGGFSTNDRIVVRGEALDGIGAAREVPLGERDGGIKADGMIGKRQQIFQRRGVGGGANSPRAWGGGVQHGDIFVGEGRQQSVGFFRVSSRRRGGGLRRRDD